MTAPVPPLAHLLHRLAPDGSMIADAELLRRYAENGDEAAFELLLWRHGHLIWGVCRRVAPDWAAAEDAFQATALALARHAGAIRGNNSVAGWLYRVAYRAALRTRSRQREETVSTFPEQPDPAPNPADAAAVRELAGVIDAEVNRLPEPFRVAFVLCDLGGKSNAEAAAVLGCPVGTVESRLTRARSKLRDRLSSRGVVLSALPVTGAVPGTVHAAAVRAATDPASVRSAIHDLAAHAVKSSRPGYVLAAGFALVAGVALAVGIAVAATPNPPLAPPLPPTTKTAEPAKTAPEPIEASQPRRLGNTRFRHSGMVFHAAFSPDGKKLATGAIGSVSVWETATGKLLRRIERAEVPFYRVAFTADGKALYAVVGPVQGGCDLFTFDPQTGKELAQIQIRTGFFQGAEFAPDGSRLAVFSTVIQNEVVLIDPKTGKELVRMPAYFTGNAFTADSKALVLAGGEETVRVVDATTGKELSKLNVKDRRPQWVRFLTQTDVLFAGYNSVERWDLKKNAAMWKTDGFLPSGRGLEVSPDGNRAAHVSPFAVTLFDVETGKELIRRNARIGGTAAAFSPNSEILAITTASGTVVLIDAITGERLPQSPDLIGTVSGLTFSADGRKLAAVDGDRWVRWDLTAAEPRAESLANFTCLSPAGRVGVRPDTFNRGDTQAEFVDPVTGKLIAKFDPAETGYTVDISRADYKRGLFSGDGTRFVGLRRTPRGPGGQQTELGVATWDTATGKRLTQRPPDKDSFLLLAVSQDGKAVAVHLAGGGKTQIAVWEPDGNTLRWTRDVGTGQFFVAFADGGSKLVVQEFHVPRVLLGPGVPVPPGPYPFLVLDAATGKEIAKATGPILGEQPLVFSVGQSSYIPQAKAISPDGKTLAVSGWDGTIYLWDLASDRQKAKLTHPGPVHDLAFSPDGKTLAAASQAAPVMLYDVTASVAKP